MVSKINKEENVVCLVGLGYVGLPLAEMFSQHFRVIGFDIDKEKIKRLSSENSDLEFTSDSLKIKLADFVIITVPTPVTRSKEPDLSLIESAARIVGQNLKKGAVVVLESTVYPGVTEDIIGPILSKESELVLGRDFKIGYSPERVNPGDRNHTIDKITKIVSG
ncbi:nucleotide sugar dehydrogenase, partial [bacterium]|nr:nucleotide sugar dehydrogenase [bacterium]